MVQTCHGSKLRTQDVLSLFRQTTCSASASIHYNTLRVRKIYSYSDSQEIVKLLIVHLHLLLSSNSVQTAHRKTGVSNQSNSVFSFRRQFLVCSHAKHMKLVLLPWSHCCCYDVWLRCSFDFVSISLND